MATAEIFDRMAPGWYNFRHRTLFRAELRALAGRWQKGRLLNIGCGHGADFIPFKENLELHGLDFSPQMLRLAQKYATRYGFAPQLVLGDIRCLPYQDSCFDWVIAVATLHHLGDKAGRLAALAELRRILKPGGEAFVTVWNRGQPRFWFKGQDILVPWRSRDEVLQRYYHLFTFGELAKLVVETGLRIIRSFPENSYRFPLKYFSRNICLVLMNPKV